MGFVKYSVAPVDVIEKDKDLPAWVSEANKEAAAEPPAVVVADLEEETEDDVSEEN